MIRYSFCETATASPYSKWHIRILTTSGRKLGGGADTRSLCGIAVAWDLDVELTEHHLNHCCEKCKQEFDTATVRLVCPNQ